MTTASCPGSATTTSCAFDVSASSLSTTCGSSVNLSANCTGANCDGVSYSWSGNGASQQGQTLNLTAPSTNGTYSYTVTATRTGCTPKTAVATVTVTGCTPPQNCAFDVTATSLSTTCGSSVNLSAGCTGANCDGVSYSWSGNGASQQGQTLNLTAPSTNGSYSYTVTATRNGCDSKTAVATVTVTGCAQPQNCAFEVTASSLSATCGSSVNLSANCTGANCDGVSYSWSGNGASQQGQVLNLTAPSTNGSYSYTVTATRNGCDSKTAVATVTVTGCAQPQNCAFEVTANNVSTTCGTSVNLNANCTGANCDGVSYSWSGNGASQQGQTLNLTAPSTNGTYSYTVTATRNGCDSKTAVATVTVTGCAQPQNCAFEVTANNVSTTCGTSVNLNAGCTGANCDGVSYSWSGNGASQQGQTLNLTAPSTNGTYSYTVTATRNGCTAKTAVVTVTVTGCAQPQPNADYRGFLDNANCNVVNGWVLDAKSTQKSQSIDIFINGTKATTIVADQVRADVGRAYNTGSFAQFGYAWAIPQSYKNNTQLVISVKAAGSSFELTQSPKTTATCPSSATVSTCDFKILANSVNTTCGSSVNLNANCTGSSCDGLSYTWSGNGISQQGQTLNLTAPSTNGTYSYTATATRTGCESKTAVATVTVTGCAQPQNCAFDVTATSLNTTCGTSVNLNAGCTGANCDGVSYSWSGNGASQLGQTLNLTAPSTNGTYSYTVTATRNGCDSKTAVATVTVTGCAQPQNCAFEVTANNVSTTCGTSVNLNANCTGANCDGVSYSWSGNGASQQGQTLNLTAPSTNGTYSYTVTATRNGCTAKTAVVTVTVTGCTPTQNCAFDVTATNVNASCGGNVTLNANCTGANCDGVSYSWSGNGVSQQGQALNLTAPSTNGTYFYTVTATRSGCDNKVAIGTVTVDGCTTSNEPYPILNSPQPGDKRPILQNDRVRVAIDLGVGGVLREVTDLQVGENMINCYVKGDGKRDTGRDDQIALYGYPEKGFTKNGKPVLDDIGYNPVQGGSIAGEYSPILAYGRTDKMLYSKTRALHWGVSNEPGDYIIEQWIRLENNVVRRHVRITGDRPEQTKYVDSRQQELPCTYTSSMFYQFYVVRGEPYTNAPLVNVNSIPNIDGSGTSMDQYKFAGRMGPFNVDASEPWIAAVRSNTNRGIALHTPYSHEFKAALFDSPGIGPPESINAGYISNGVTMILDPNGVYEYDINMVVGTLDEIRSTINTLPRSETKPNYVFANTPTRHGFTYRKGYDQGYPVGGNELTITPTDRRFRLVSPRKGYKASEFGVVYVRMRAITPETQLLFDWRKVGQTELEAESGGQSIRFNIIPDNQYHTYAIPVRNSALWNGIINNFTIRYVNTREESINGQQFGVKWISATDLGDQ